MDIETINYLADLARIEIPENEKESMIKDLGGVLTYVDQIKDVASKLDPNQESLYTKTNVVSDDAPIHVGGQFTKSILDGAPDSVSDHIVVKKVL